MWKKRKITKISIGLKYGPALLVVALFAAFAFGCVSGTEASNISDYFSTAPNFDPELAQKLQTALDSAVSDEGVPGAVMAVETPKGVWIGAAGKADLSTGRAMTADTQVRIASITKPFTAALILKLVEEGKLHLNDTLEHLLPRAVPYGDQITVAMLLSHTSGIPDHENTPEWSDRLLADPTAPWSSEDVLAIIRNHEAEFEQPGKNYSYCNTGYYLLGMVAEAVTGNTVANEINNRFFQPIGMSRTALTRAGKKTEPYAHDYCWVEDQLMDSSSWDLSWDWTAGSAVTTAGNMLIWTRAFFGGEVVSTATLEQMITPVPPAAEHGYGFGLAITDSEPLFGERLVHHSGANPGVHAQWLYYPESNRTIFVALNRQDTSEPPQVDVGAVMSSILTDVCDILKETEVNASAIPEEVDSIITAPKYNHSTWGIIFEDLETGEVIYEFNVDKLFIPASVTKLYSTAVALDTLGADYGFRTPIYRTGEVGDLVLVASGDMTMGGRDLDGHIEYTSIDHCDANGLEGAILTEQDPLNGLNQLARQVVDSGINNVSDVIIDDRLFEEMRFEEYVVSPIMINDNLIDIVITPTKEGELATVEWRPHTVLYNVSSSVETVAAGSPAQIEITSETETINVKGQIPVGKYPLVRVCRVENPATFARSLLIEALEREGVEVTASALSENPSEKLPDNYSNLTEVAVLESLPFSENIKLILKVSQNVHADTLPFLVGVKHGTKDFYEGIHAGLPFFLGAEIDANEISFGDGRGDERSNLVTPRATVKLLRSMSNRPDFEHYYNSLPIMGVDGSLAMIENEVVQGKVRAKTGTILAGDALSFRLLLLSKALAGYMNTSSGRQVVFSMFVNNVPIDQTDDMFLIMNDQAKICERVYEYY